MLTIFMALGLAIYVATKYRHENGNINKCFI